MATQLKLMFDENFFKDICTVIEKVYPPFQTGAFLAQVHDESWEEKELKGRIRQISAVLHEFLEGSYTNQLDTILGITNELRIKTNPNGHFGYMIFPDFIEQFGIDDYELSMEAIERITKLISCEFCIRPFILKHPVDTLERMLLWASHDHPQVRRLASEGCRPRLPWAMALPFLKQDPRPILPILDTLRNDPAETVRRSVANNLNDISKDNPDLVKEIFKRWIGETEFTDWIVKHGARTLLKLGDPDSMELFGYSKNHPFKLSDFSIINPQIKIGDKLNFSFCIQNTANLESKLRLEYVIYYLLANGSYGRKVFKISERIIPPKSIVDFWRSHSFKKISTRKYYFGNQMISIKINGNEFHRLQFLLLE